MYFIPFHKDVAQTLLFLYKKKKSKKQCHIHDNFQQGLFLVLTVVILYSSCVIPEPNIHQKNTVLHLLHNQPHIRFINA